ncbi:MAG TPA: GTP cyclohydrolase II RibA [Pseudolabrys sp.]|nr:GTP cyclohydrolase II RibA [Pseudolabrys sp.]
MGAVLTGISSTLFGSKEHTSVSRGVAEFLSRRPVLITAPNETLLALPVEGLDSRRLTEFKALCAPSVPYLVITSRRAHALGIDAKSPMAMRLSADDNTYSILAFVTDATSDRIPGAAPACRAAAAAIQLVKLSQGLPAVLAADLGQNVFTSEPEIITIEADAVGSFSDYAVQSLTLASEAAVPLNSGVSTRFIVFRDAMGGIEVAIIVGKPDLAKAVPVRLHSACLTADVFGSRRCDCGDQLRLAVARLDELGGGIVLYLAQEGRGLGLANKMRTYRLQDDGLDTVDANTTLGFDDDERDYRVAARMLKMLKCTRVILLTNNPAKLDRLSKAGIEIVNRMPIEAPINADNRRYMTAKATRAGHRLDQLVAHLADPS